MCRPPFLPLTAFFLFVFLLFHCQFRLHPCRPSLKTHKRGRMNCAIKKKIRERETGNRLELCMREREKPVRDPDACGPLVSTLFGLSPISLSRSSSSWFTCVLLISIFFAAIVFPFFFLPPLLTSSPPFYTLEMPTVCECVHSFPADVYSDWFNVYRTARLSLFNGLVFFTLPNHTSQTKQKKRKTFSFRFFSFFFFLSRPTLFARCRRKR